MIDDLAFARALRVDISKTLESLCCDSLTFMWVNSILSPRDEWFDAGCTEGGVLAKMRFIMGFRVRRQFMYWKRDAVIYRCPFCNNELIIPLGYTDFKGAWMNPTTRMGIGIPGFQVPKAKLERELRITKAACKGIWPPKD